jgi:agmatine deiminase
MLHNLPNTLYLADLLPKLHPKFWKQFEKELIACNVPLNWLPNTKDNWAIDYMPVQIRSDKMVQFTYRPDYLSEYPETKTDTKTIFEKLGIKIVKSAIVVDGGNLVRSGNTAIMCDKVFHENPKIGQRELINQLVELLEIDRLLFVPWQTDDFTGHTDGMVRFVNEKTVLVNDSGKHNKIAETSVNTALHNAGFECIPLPCALPYDPTQTSVRGLYINYLHMEQAIFVPVYGLKTDEQALRILEDTFKGSTIVPVEASEIAKKGGVLNCISWSIIT